MTTEETHEDQDDTSAHPLTDDDLQEDLAKALTLAEENLAGWKRTQADFENFRRRSQAESADFVALGKQKAFNQLLPVIDSLQQALLYAPDVADEQYQQWKRGLQGIVKQIDTALRESGITKIDAVGQKFDPHLHEAVREIPGDADGMVAEQYQQGYSMDGRVIRPAQVAITKAGSTTDASDEHAEQ